MSTKLPNLHTQHNLYQALEIENFSCPEEIKRGFRNLALKYHPDRSPLDGEAQGRFLLGADAYRFLKDPTRKKAYDRHLKQSLANTSGYKKNQGTRQDEMPVSGFYIKRYTKDTAGRWQMSEKMESLQELIQKTPRKRQRSSVYHPGKMEAEELRTLVEDGRDHFKNFLNSLPKYERE